MDVVEYRAEFIRDLRSQMKCEQTEFALIVDVSPATLSRWENGRAKPRDSKWERMHDLKTIVRSCENTERLKRKLMMGASLVDNKSPMDLLIDGELKSEMQDSIDDERFLEEIHLESGLKWDDLIRRKLSYWKQLLKRGEVPIKNKQAWTELIEYVVPVAKLVKFITGVGIMSDKSRARFARTIYWIDISRSIKREPLQQLISHGTRMEGYAIVLAELTVDFDRYREDTREITDRDPDEQWEAVEEWWERVSGWDGDERLDELLPRIKDLCQIVLSDVTLKYQPKSLELLFDN